MPAGDVSRSQRSLFSVDPKWVSRSFASRFGLRFAVVLTMLLWPWSGLGHAMGRVVCPVYESAANLVISSLGSVRIFPEGSSESWAAVLVMTNWNGISETLHWDLRRLPYIPLTVHVAITLAYPNQRWTRRLGVLALGLLALQFLPLLRLLGLLSGEGRFRLLELPFGFHSLLVVACRAVVFPPSMAYVFPALVWIGSTALIDRPALPLMRRGSSPDSLGSDSTVVHNVRRTAPKLNSNRRRKSRNRRLKPKKES